MRRSSSTPRWASRITAPTSACKKLRDFRQSLRDRDGVPMEYELHATNWLGGAWADNSKPFQRPPRRTVSRGGRGAGGLARFGGRGRDRAGKSRRLGDGTSDTSSGRACRGEGNDIPDRRCGTGTALETDVAPRPLPGTCSRCNLAIRPGSTFCRWRISPRMLCSGKKIRCSAKRLYRSPRSGNGSRPGRHSPHPVGKSRPTEPLHPKAERAPPRGNGVSRGHDAPKSRPTPVIGFPHGSDYIWLLPRILHFVK